MPQRLEGVMGRLEGYGSRLDLFELGASMTLLMIVLSLHDPAWYIRLGVSALAVSALLVRPLMRNPGVWFGLVLLFALSFLGSWPEQNNHDYLKLYWCVGIGIALLAPDSTSALRVNARLLIGLCFLFAFTWKAVSADYIDGSFFTYSFLQDARFNVIAETIGGLSGGELSEGRSTRIASTAFGSPEEAIAVPFAGRVRWLALALTWWTLFIEAAVAVAFLLPQRYRVGQWRDAVLVAFLLTTYLVTPILYFAWLITAMAVVQSEERVFRYWPSIYVGILLLVLMRFYVPV